MLTWIFGIAGIVIVFYLIDNKLNLDNLKVKPVKKSIYKDYAIGDDGIIQMIEKVNIRG